MYWLFLETGIKFIDFYLYLLAGKTNEEGGDGRHGKTLKVYTI